MNGDKPTYFKTLPLSVVKHRQGMFTQVDIFNSATLLALFFLHPSREEMAVKIILEASVWGRRTTEAQRIQFGKVC